jgi:hypothetical protein
MSKGEKLKIPLKFDEAVSDFLKVGRVPRDQPKQKSATVPDGAGKAMGGKNKKKVSRAPRKSAPM